MEYARLKRESSSVLSASKESSAQAASAARIRRDAPPWLGLLTTRGLDEDTAQRQRMREIRHGLPFLDADAGVPRRREPAELRDPALGALDDWLSERAERVAATPAELAVAESRAQAVTEALAAIYPGADVYQTGSIAHGDALSPLNDVDLGVILTNRPDLGPDPGQSGPQEEMRRTAARLADLLRPQFPNVTADPNNKRSIVLEFNDPATPGADDFTCDVIIALEQPGRPRISRTKPDKAKPDRTLLIPNTGVSAGWDENDPRGHVELLRQADAASGGSFSRTVRLVKHWRSGQSEKPFYSWNIKTLALEAGADSTQPFEGLYRFFLHALYSVAEGPTENPGSANFPPPTVAADRLEVTRQLIEALRTLRRARMYALANMPLEAEAELRGLFPADGS